jgi:hypothetical protein
MMYCLSIWAMDVTPQFPITYRDSRCMISRTRPTSGLERSPSPEHRESDADRSGSHRQRFENICAAAKSAIHEDRDFATVRVVANLRRR